MALDQENCTVSSIDRDDEDFALINVNSVRPNNPGTRYRRSSSQNFVHESFSTSMDFPAYIPWQTLSSSLNDLCLPLYMVVEQIREAYDDDDVEESVLTDRWLSYEDIEMIYDEICATVVHLQELRGSKKTSKFSAQSIEFGKLVSSFKGLVGTKVANKWKRNRAEL